jgi:hypothetical protein
MSIYVWEYGAQDTGLHFTITYDSDAQTFEVTSLEGKFDLNALWWDNGTDDNADVSLSKSDSSLNMNGSTSNDWDGYAKLSNAGLGTLGEDKHSFISSGETETFNLSEFGIKGAFDPANGGTLGVRATSVNGGGSIKLVDDTPIKDPAPPPADIVTANDDSQACGVEGLVKITGNVLTNDTDTLGDDLDVTQVNGIDLAVLDPLHVGNVYTIQLTDGTLVLNSESGDFTFTYTGPNLPVGDEWEGSFDYTITDGDISNDSAESVYTATVDLCIDAAAGSQGYWTGGSPEAVSEGFANAIGSQTFDDYFHLDALDLGLDDSAGGRSWSGVKGNGDVVFTATDLTFLQALDFGQGPSNGNTTTPTVNGNIGDLVREAATAVLNFYDADGHAAFVAAYEAQYGAFSDANDDIAVLNNLRSRVEAAIESGDVTAPYEIDLLAAQLHLTHE